MNDAPAHGNLLTRLVGQAGGQQPSLVPRLPALFEPAGPSPVAPSPHTAVGEVASRHDALRAPFDDDESATRARAAPPALARAVDGRPARPAATPAVAPQVADTRAAVGRVAEAAPPRASGTAVPSPSPALGALPPLRTRAAARPSALDQAAAPGRAAAIGRSSVDPRTPVLGTPDRSLARSRGDARTTADAGTAPATGPKPGPATLSAAPSPVPWPHRRDRSGPAAATEPVVRVSIGRIEVRAVVAAAAPSPSNARPQAVGLDDYLQQRGRSR